VARFVIAEAIDDDMARADLARQIIGQPDFDPDREGVVGLMSAWAVFISGFD